MAEITPLVQMLDRRYKTLRSQRTNWENHWQQLADYMLPEKLTSRKRECKVTSALS